MSLFKIEAHLAQQLKGKPKVIEGNEPTWTMVEVSNTRQNYHIKIVTETLECKCESRANEALNSKKGLLISSIMAQKNL